MKDEESMGTQHHTFRVTCGYVDFARRVGCVQRQKRKEDWSCEKSFGSDPEEGGWSRREEGNSQHDTDLRNPEVLQQDQGSHLDGFPQSLDR